MKGLTISRLQCIDPHDRRDAIANSFERARSRKATMGMGDKANVGKVFPFDEVGDVRYVRIEIYVFAQEVRAIRQSRQC